MFIARLPLSLRPEGVRCISSRARCSQARQAPASVPVTPKRSSREEIAPPSPLPGASKKPLHFFFFSPQLSFVFGTSSAPLKGEIDAREGKRNPDTASGSLARPPLPWTRVRKKKAKKKKNLDAIVQRFSCCCFSRVNPLVRHLIDRGMTVSSKGTRIMFVSSGLLVVDPAVLGVKVLAL